MKKLIPELPCLLFFISFLLIGCNPAEDALDGELGDVLPEIGVVVNNPETVWHLGANDNIPTQVSSEFTKTEQDMIIDLTHKWNAATNESPKFFELNKSNKINDPKYGNYESYGNDGVNGIYKSYTWYNTLSSFALAVTYSTGERIHQGTAAEYIRLDTSDILVNYRDFKFSIDPNDNDLDENGNSDIRYDLPTVLLHELGHFIGLGHVFNSPAPTIMAPRINSKTIKREVFPIDFDNINSLYEKYFGATPVLTSVTSALGTQSDEPRQGDRVIIIQELRSDNKCYHYEDGELTLIH